MVPGLCIYPSGRQPQRIFPPLPESAPHLPGQRALARSRLSLYHMGSCPWHLSDPGNIPEPQASARFFLPPAHFRRSMLRMGIFPGQYLTGRMAYSFPQFPRNRKSRQLLKKRRHLPGYVLCLYDIFMHPCSAFGGLRLRFPEN